MLAEFFTIHDDVLDPQPAAFSGWDPTMMRGPAVTGALARAAEHAVSDDALRPAHATFELFRPARMVPTMTDVAVVRRGRRLCLVDAYLLQADQQVARAHITFVAATDEPTGRLWHSQGPIIPPDSRAQSDAEGRLYRSDDGWTRSAAEHVNSAHKFVWQRHRTMVRGEEPTPFQSLASAADLTSLVVHWGSHGIEFINANVSMAFSRLPEGPGIGLSAIQFDSDAGISAGSATLFDERGSFGSSSVTGLANTSRAVKVEARARLE